jgi:hypothetical protein
MAMNILQIHDRLKGTPDSQLMQYVQQPTGEIPQFMVAAEMKRREEMRAKVAEAPSTTVVEDLEQAGLAALQPPPQEEPAPEQMDAGLAALPTDMPEAPSMAGGGIIAFEDGGDVERFAAGKTVKRPAYLSNPVGKYFDPADLEQYDDKELKKLLKENPSLSLEDIRRQQEALRETYGIENLLAEQKTALEEDKAANEKFLSGINDQALVAMGAGMMSSQSPFFGAGVGAGLQNLLATKQAGQKEYRANAKDIRNLGFEIARSDQAARQAIMSGDQALYNAERTRHDGLVTKAEELKYKSTDAKNALLTKGASEAAGYDTNVKVASIRESGDDKRARAKSKSDLFNKAQDNAITQMSKLYPLGAQDPKFTELKNKGSYKTATEAYNAELEKYRLDNLVSMAAEAGIDPKEIVDAPKAPPPVPTDKKQLVAGTVYNTARGPARWDGSQFVAIQ